MDPKSESVAIITDAEGPDRLERNSNTPQIPPSYLWPTKPRTLKKTCRQQVVWSVHDFFLVLMPLLLIGKIGLCIHAEQEDREWTGDYLVYTSRLSHYLASFNSQLVTLFTIVFVVVFSTFLRRLTLWRAQRGARLVDLEQLQGSLSLPSTLKLAWQLRSFGVKSLVLISAWSFYYLGSQAAKLEYRVTDSRPPAWLELAFPSASNPSLFDTNITEILAAKNKTLLFNGSFRGSISALDRLFAAAMANYNSLSPTSVLNGPLIRNLDPYNTYGHEGWVDTSTTHDGEFASIVDIPLLGINGSAYAVIGHFTMSDVGYFNVNCSGPEILVYEAFPQNVNRDSAISLNTTNHTNPAQFSFYLRDRFLDYSESGDLTTSNGVDPNSEWCRANYWTCYEWHWRTLRMTCTIVRQFIDMQVHCSASGCVAQATRWHNNSNYEAATSFQTPFEESEFAQEFFSNLILSTGPQFNGYETDVMSVFFRSSGDGFGSRLGNAQCHLNIDCHLFSQYDSVRLSQAFNTYYMLSQQLLITPNYGGHSTSDNLFSLDRVKNGTDPFFEYVKFRGSYVDPAYRISWGWLAVDLIACLILLAAAIASCWLRIYTVAPDVFGYVSSLTRDDPNFELPSKASTLDGLDRARKLRNVKVKIGEFSSDSGSFITFTHADHVQTLNSKKKYG